MKVSPIFSPNAIQNKNFYIETCLQTKQLIDLIARQTLSILKLTFETQKMIISFPSRYLGAKINLGNSDKREHLTLEDAKKYIPFAALTATAYKGNEEWITPFDLNIFDLNTNFDLKSLPGNLEVRGKYLYDDYKGLKIAVATDQNNGLFITFGARGSKGFQLETRSAIGQWKAVIGNLLGFKPELYSQADTIFKYIQNHPNFKGKKITLCGHSMASGIAAYVALQNEIPAVCFNSVPLGAGLQESIGEKKLKNAPHLITQISNPGDFTSDLKGIGKIDRLFNLIHIRTPGIFGKRHWFPASPECKNFLEVHGNIMGSLMKHIGYRDGQRMHELSQDDMNFIRNSLIN